MGTADRRAVLPCDLRYHRFTVVLGRQGLLIFRQSQFCVEFVQRRLCFFEPGNILEGDHHPVNYIVRRAIASFALVITLLMARITCFSSTSTAHNPSGKAHSKCTFEPARESCGFDNQRFDSGGLFYRLSAFCKAQKFTGQISGAQTGRLRSLQ